MRKNALVIGLKVLTNNSLDSKQYRYETISTGGGRMRLITKQAAKLKELETRRERLVNRVAKLDLKIEEQKEKIAQYYRKQGINV